MAKKEKLITICPHCGLECYTLDALKRHVEWKHGESK